MIDERAMGKWIALICLLLMSPGLALSADSVTEYRNALDECAGESVWTYDDGVTSANVVAKVLVGICRRKNQALYSLVIAAHSNSWVTGFERAATEQFTGFVLWHRANKAKTAR